MKKKICLILLCVVSAFACAFGLVACDDNAAVNGGNKQGRVPVYQGMTISEAAGTASLAKYSVTAMPLAAGGEAGDSGNHYGWYKDKDKDIDQDEPFGEENESIEDIIDGSLKVTGSVEKIYYATLMKMFS